MQSTGVLGSSASMVIRARNFGVMRSRRALDTSQPDPSNVLLSALEAKERLREIVEGFFFRRRK